LLKLSKNFTLHNLFLLFFTAYSGVCEAQTHQQDVALKPLPRIVLVSFAFNEIRNINSYDHSFYADFYLRLKWLEPLAENQAAFQQLKESDKLWYPKLDFINATNIEQRTSEGYSPIVLAEPGTLIMDQRFTGTFSSTMDLRKFPHDAQYLNIRFEDYDLDKARLQFRYENSKQNTQEIDRQTIHKLPLADAFEGDIESLAEWQLEEIAVVESAHTYEFYDSSRYSQFRIEIKLQRQATYYNLKIISICLIIAMISWLAMFIDPENLGERTGISVTSLLALVAHNYVANDILPRIAYLTSLDLILLGSQLVVFIFAIENLLVYLFCCRYKRSTDSGRRIAKFIDRKSRIAYLLLLTSLPILYANDISF